jgi:hypothetical protein
MITLLLTTALAEPLARLDHLVEVENWTAAASLCDKQGFDRSDDSDVRGTCARAAWLAESPDTGDALLAFAERWRGTFSGERAFERAAVALQPGAEADEAALLAHADRFEGTPASRASERRAGLAAWDAADATNTEAAWLDFASRYPAGDRARRAREAAQAAAVREARFDGSFLAVRDRYPDAEDAVRAEAAAWMLESWAASLRGDCWQVSCGALEGALVLNGPGAIPGLVEPPRVRWVLTRDGEHVDPAPTAAVIGLDEVALADATRFRTSELSRRWEAPWPWAQPPARLDASWSLELTVTGQPPLEVPLLATSRWAGIADEVLYTWADDGLVAWLSGTAMPLWEDPPSGTPELAHGHQVLWAADDAGLLRADLRGGEVTRVALPGRLEALRVTPEGVVGRLEGRWMRCTLGGCAPVASGAQNGWSVSHDDGWSLRDADGISRLSDVGRAALDRSGHRVLNWREQGDRTELRLLDSGGALLASASEWMGPIERVRPAGYDGAFLLEVLPRGAESGLRTELVEAVDGRLVREVLSPAEAVVASLGAWRHRVGLPFREGFEVETRVQGSGFVVRMLRDTTNDLVLHEEIGDTGGGCQADGDTEVWWLPGYRYAWVDITRLVCSDGEGGRSEHAQRLVDLDGGRVWEAGDAEEIARNLSPSGRSLLLRSWTGGNHLLEPAGTTALPADARHGTWGRGPAFLATLPVAP